MHSKLSLKLAGAACSVVGAALQQSTTVESVTSAIHISVRRIIFSLASFYPGEVRQAARRRDRRTVAPGSRRNRGYKQSNILSSTVFSSLLGFD